VNIHVSPRDGKRVITVKEITRVRNTRSSGVMDDDPPDRGMQITNKVLKFLLRHLLRLERRRATKPKERTKHLPVGTHTIVHPFGCASLARRFPLCYRDTSELEMTSARSK